MQLKYLYFRGKYKKKVFLIPSLFIHPAFVTWSFSKPLIFPYQLLLYSHFLCYTDQCIIISHRYIFTFSRFKLIVAFVIHMWKIAIIQLLRQPASFSASTHSTELPVGNQVSSGPANNLSCRAYFFLSIRLLRLIWLFAPLRT